MMDLNVLSLFDGMSCGQIALKELGVTPSLYYASEIDRHAIAQTQLNFPNTIQLGSVTEVDVSKLERIDLLIGGSPCQSFSFAGKRKGMSTKDNIEILSLEQYLQLKSEGFEFEGQSYLFWEYMRILTDIREYNPHVLFLLENVEMEVKWEGILSQAIGLFGAHINSALVSAQNRKRIYWTNIRTNQIGLFGELHSDIPQPEDRGILLRDILESYVDEKYYLSEKMQQFLKNHSDKKQSEGCGFKYEPTTGYTKASAITQRVHKMGVDDNYICISSTQKHATYTTDKSSAMVAAMGMGGGHVPMIVIPEATEKGFIEILPGECFDFENPKSTTRRGRKMDLKSNSLMSQNMSFMNYTSEQRVRRLTPSECAKLQTIPDWYVWKCSDTQQYRMLGNGWTVEVIKHIFSFLPKNIFQ